MKIAIIGNPGSGKSTLALQLHAITGIPVYHLDQYYWKPGWQRPDQEEFTKIHHALCDKNSWIIEGMATSLFDYRAEKADIIIFLDASLWLCLYRICKRALTCYGTIKKAAPKGCPERIPSWEFLSYIWNFNHKNKPMIESILEKNKQKKKIFIVQNSEELARLIEKFKSKTI